jgi:hypothetical protein
MPELIVTIHDSWLTIDGELPPGWRLIVHNHSGDRDFYPYMSEVNACTYDRPAEDIDDEDAEEGVSCFLYTESSAATS